jgi:hypothetical protein
MMDLDRLTSSAVCTVDFSVVPVGAHPPPLRNWEGVFRRSMHLLITRQISSESPSFSREIAEIQQLMQQSGLKFQMHATGTTVGR